MAPRAAGRRDQRQQVEVKLEIEGEMEELHMGGDCGGAELKTPEVDGISEASCMISFSR